MNLETPADAARDDLAFMRGLVQSGADIQRPFGEAYFAAGLCYGVQMLLHLGQHQGLVGSEGLLAMVIALGPTAVFTVLMIWLSIRNRAPPIGANLVSRTMGAVFMAIGVSNLALVVIIGSQAIRLKNVEIWLIYPCVVLTLQGAAWLVVWTLRRRAWVAVVAAGWFATGITMALFIGNPLAILLTGSFGLFAFMIAPGAYMMRQPKGA